MPCCARPRALVKEQFYDVPETPEVVVAEFRARFYDSELFFPKFANYLFAAHQNPPSELTKVQVHRFIEEAQLFIEGAYTCFDKIAVPRRHYRLSLYGISTTHQRQILSRRSRRP